MRNEDRVAELRGLVQGDNKADWVANLWTTYNNQRAKKVSDWSETQKYLFAVDTTTTQNQMLPWTHNTTTPKLTNIRDNLHSNYLSSLFPNDKWLTWQAYSADAAKKETAGTIRAYMDNKTREGGFTDTISLLLYDYIDYGNAFAMPTFTARYKTTATEKVASFIGPEAVRISPYDIVFNPTADSFDNTFKIVKSVTTLGALRKMVDDNPDQAFWNEVLERRSSIRDAAKSFSQDEWTKVDQYAVDGFGSLYEYYMSDSVEILEFFGDYHDSLTGELTTNRMITVVDRSSVARDVENPSYGGKPLISHIGWRKRPDNLWAMGPLDNLIGMQYMIDHYVNMAANALDLKVLGPRKIIGDVEPFEWGPNAEIHIDEGGDVQEMNQQFGDIFALMDFVEKLEQRMELYAGAPREAMGVRTPGEKTAFEVQALENAAGRIFQEKIVQFEIFMEEILNNMLEESHRNLDQVDIIRIIDDDLGVEQFKRIVKEDITSDGILRPVGARHFAQRAQELQNLVGVFNSPIAPLIAPHTSGIGLTEFVNDIVDLRGYNLFQPNVAVAEQQQTQALASSAEEDNLAQSQISEDEVLVDAAMAEEAPQQ